MQHPPFFEDMGPEPDPVSNVTDARVLGLFLDSITTDHISPAGSIPKASRPASISPAIKVRPAEFNSYGSRRGNHEVMMRGTFANIRIKNQMVEASKAAAHAASLCRRATQMPIYDAAMAVPEGQGSRWWCVAGKEYGTGSQPRLGRQGFTTAAGGAGRDHRII